MDSAPPIGAQDNYGLLMRAAADALMTLAAGRLGARIGLIAVLRTWGQTLTHHPHVHCLVPGGGVALDGRRWIPCKPKTFRRLFLDGLAAAFERGELGFFGDLAPLADPDAFAGRVRALRNSPFVVYAKAPFGGPERVLAYLARYTHRTAIANSRLIAVDDNEVAFSYKDYRRAGRERVMRLAPREFIQRFLLHVLPASTASVITVFSPAGTAPKTSNACAPWRAPRPPPCPPTAR